MGAEIKTFPRASNGTGWKGTLLGESIIHKVGKARERERNSVHAESETDVRRNTSRRAESNDLSEERRTGEAERMHIRPNKSSVTPGSKRNREMDRFYILVFGIKEERLWRASSRWERNRSRADG